MSPWTEQEKNILQQMWLEESRETILAKISRTWKALRRQAENMNLKRLRLSYCERYKYSVESIPSWLIGEMISDGHIDPRGRYSHTTKHHSYAKFLAKKFTGMGVKTNVYPKQYFDQRTNK